MAHFVECLDSMVRSPEVISVTDDLTVYSIAPEVVIRN